MPIDDEEKRKQLPRFLQDLRETILNGTGLKVINRHKNRSALIELGLTERIREEEILDLSVLNYCSGPEINEESPGANVWIFGKEINDAEVYIKLKLFTIEGVDYITCISFHKAERPLTFPFE